MVVSGTPTSLAVVAAPIRKLCALNFDPSRPAAVKARWMLSTNACRRSGVPPSVMKSGPGVQPLRLR